MELLYRGQVTMFFKHQGVAKAEILESGTESKTRLETVILDYRNWT